MPAMPHADDIDKDTIFEAIGAALAGDSAATHVVQSLNSQYPGMNGAIVRDILTAALFSIPSTRADSDDVCMHAHGRRPATREDDYSVVASDGGPVWSLNFVSDADSTERDFYEVGLMLEPPASIRRLPPTVMYWVLVDGPLRGVRLCTKYHLTSYH